MMSPESRIANPSLNGSQAASKQPIPHPVAAPQASVPHVSSPANISLPNIQQGGVSTPQTLLPIKSRSFELTHLDGSPYDGVDLVCYLKKPNSRATQAFEELIQWSGIEKMPLTSMAPVIPVCGSSMVAAGLAMSLVKHHDSNKKSQKIALLEWGHIEGCLHALLNIEAPNIGISELFENQCDLTHLMLNAKVYRPIPQLYAIGQGQIDIDPMEGLARLSQLMAVLSKKFHRIILSLPNLEAEPRLPEMLNRLGLNYGLFYDPDETLLGNLAPIRSIWPNGIIQRLTS